jgi:hypothetical protein
MKPERIRTLFFPFIICAAALSLFSCATQTRMAVNQLDTPGHHTYAGLKLLDLEKYSDAQREFKMAIQLDNNYSKAYTGMALVNIFTGKLDSALENLTSGSKCATSDEDRLFVNVAEIRYYSVSKTDSKWLESAVNQFDDAVKINAKYSPAYYYMGLAYKEGLHFDEAAEMFTNVVQIKKDFIADAGTQLKFMQKIKQANPVTEAGKKIALVEHMTRADAAILFTEELKLKDLYKKPEAKLPEEPVKEKPAQTDKTSMEEPLKKEEKADVQIKAEEKIPADAPSPVPATLTVTTSVSAPAPAPAPAVIIKLLANDIAEHPQKKVIEEILETGVRGLENDPKGNFNPGEVLSRGEYAIIMEGVLVKLTGEKDIAARYVNEKSLFPDVPSDMPYFKAITAVTSQGIMEAKNIKTGEFAPLKPLSGADALLAIRKLKDKLKIN